MAKVTLTGWIKGLTNRFERARVPENYVRRVVNLDPLPGGSFALRTGYDRVYTGTAVHGVLALGDMLLIADGTSLIELNTVTTAVRVVRTIPATGSLRGDVLNGVLYFCTANECLEYDGAVVRQWGVPNVTVQPVCTAGVGGGLLAGNYFVAMTYTDVYGREGGTDASALVVVAASGSITVTVPSLPVGVTANLYVSSVNGSTLYIQSVATGAGNVVISQLRDDTARLSTQFMRAPYPGQYLASHNSLMAVAAGAVLQMTSPMRPHLVSMDTGFFQYSEDIAGVVSDGTVLFVCADKCYAVSDAETDRAAQRIVMDYPAIAGTVALLPDGRGTWMTTKGQAVTDGANPARTMHEDTFAPELTASGTSGCVDSNGSHIVVTAMKGPTKPNDLAMSDFYSATVTNP